MSWPKYSWHLLVTRTPHRKYPCLALEARPIPLTSSTPRLLATNLCGVGVESHLSTSLTPDLNPGDLLSFDLVGVAQVPSHGPSWPEWVVQVLTWSLRVSSDIFLIRRKNLRVLCKLKLSFTDVNRSGVLEKWWSVLLLSTSHTMEKVEKGFELYVFTGTSLN